MTLRLTRAAEADLIDIYLYGVQTFGTAQAEAYQDKLDHTLFLITDHPEIARLRHEITPPVRVHPVGEHMVVYLTDEAGALILRIRHQRENWHVDPASG